jgi:signal transduction histidine kinase
MTGPRPDFQLFFEESPDVLLVLLPDSPRFTAVAATKARLISTHSTLEQTIGRGLFELFPDNPDDPAANATVNLRASLERVLASKAADTMAVQKYDIPMPDGSFEVKYWSPRNIPILSATGEVLYILHRAVDVTDLARASEAGEELRGRTEDMEREVVRRSRELDAANRQLREANEKLSHLDAVKTAFFSNVSHEFRTPLTLMLGPLEDSLRDAVHPLSNAHRKRLQLAHDNALRLLKLVNELLDFSRLHAGRLRGKFAPSDFARLVRELTGMFQTAFDKAGLRLYMDCQSLSVPIWVDCDMWEKIIPNLVSNAFKFTLAGQVTVRVLETPSHAVVEVADSGTGIAQSELPQIFERFHRVTGAIGRTHEGAGIGLALVRELVELHGGTIGVDSEPGRGSVFRIEIPKGREHLSADAVVQEGTPQPNSADAAGTAAATASVGAVGTVGGAGIAGMAHATEAARWVDANSDGNVRMAMTPCREESARPLVLVVDDNADLRDYMQGLLVAHYDVITANDGRDALDRIRSTPPDIVLSDVMMPHMTGIDLVRALRSDPSTVAIPVILLSARAGAEATVEGLDAGSDDYLTKPFTAHELLARVRSHMQLAHARRKWTAELESANRELDAFSYSVAHDLRGPLRSIDGFSQLLLQENADQLDAAGRQRLGILRSAAQRMSQLIDDLLRLAHMSRGELRCVPFDLSCLVRTVAMQVQQGKGERQITLKVEEGVNVDADPHLLQIVLENLLGNAWKFTAKRADAVVEFGCEYVNDEICYYIRDNGAGFDMNYASKLFGVFQRLHPESEFQGTGIGLATVKRIVSRHGGRVWGVGEVGRGATFYFTLGGADASRFATQSAAAG